MHTLHAADLTCCASSAVIVVHMHRSEYICNQSSVYAAAAAVIVIAAASVCWCICQRTHWMVIEKDVQRWSHYCRIGWLSVSGCRQRESRSAPFLWDRKSLTRGDSTYKDSSKCCLWSRPYIFRSTWMATRYTLITLYSCLISDHQCERDSCFFSSSVISLLIASADVTQLQSVPCWFYFHNFCILLLPRLVYLHFVWFCVRSSRKKKTAPITNCRCVNGLTI